MSEEKAEAQEAEAPEAPSSGGGGNKLVFIITAVNLVVSLAVMAVLFISFKKEATKPSVADIAAHGEGHAEGAGEGGGAEGHGGGEKKAEGHGGGGEKKGEGHGEGKKKGADFGKTLPLDQFTVNLTTPGSVTPKFARASVTLELPNEDVESEVTQKMPQVRNAIIDLFNSKRPSDLATPEGRDFLKEEIRNTLNGFMVTGKVKGVFFTSFAVTP